ncbi:MAG: hypothetical protein JXA25_16095 [Anaerolineales bacterium]|nr:hypothetical protein [Anaerolineales bacterium]
MIYTLRGKKTSTAKKKVDVILVAVKLSENGQMDFARGYLRRGPVWSDLVLLQREQLIERLQTGEKVYTGAETDMVGDFEIHEQLQIETVNGKDLFIIGNEKATAEDLGLPLL